MKTTYMAAIACWISAALTAGAASLSVSATAPTQDGADIANLTLPPTSSDIINGDRPAAGQTFLTLGNSTGYTLTSLTIYNDRAVATSGGTWNLRLGTVSGSTFTQTIADTITVGGTALTLGGTGEDYITFTLTTPVFLSANTLYGIDLVRTGSGNWLTWAETGNDYGNGQSYTSGPDGVGSSTLTLAGANDRIFHLNIEAMPPRGTLFLMQ